MEVVFVEVVFVVFVDVVLVDVVLAKALALTPRAKSRVVNAAVANFMMKAGFCKALMFFPMEEWNVLRGYNRSFRARSAHVYIHC